MAEQVQGILASQPLPGQAQAGQQIPQQQEHHAPPA